MATAIRSAYGTDPQSGNPITIPEWLDRLAPKALAVVTAGTCAAFGGIHAMKGNPTGCMGVADYLGWDWKSKAGLPIVNVPGCPVQPDDFMETLLYLLRRLAGLAPMIPMDEAGVRKWLFGKTVHEGCDRAGYYEQGDFTEEYGSPKCLVKIGCWALLCSAMFPSADGWPELVVVQTLEEFVSAAQCRVSQINSCLSWTSHPARPCRRT